MIEMSTLLNVAFHQHVFHICLSHFLAFTLLYTFNTYNVLHLLKAIISVCQDDDFRSYCTFVRMLIVVALLFRHLQGCMS